MERINLDKFENWVKTHLNSESFDFQAILNEAEKELHNGADITIYELPESMSKSGKCEYYEIKREYFWSTDGRRPLYDFYNFAPKRFVPKLLAFEQAGRDFLCAICRGLDKIHDNHDITMRAIWPGRGRPSCYYIDKNADIEYDIDDKCRIYYTDDDYCVSFYMDSYFDYSTERYSDYIASVLRCFRIWYRQIALRDARAVCDKCFSFENKAAIEHYRKFYKENFNVDLYDDIEPDDLAQMLVDSATERQIFNLDLTWMLGGLEILWAPLDKQ